MNSKAVWAIVIIAGTIAVSVQATPIIEYKFNDTGTTTPSTGSETGLLVLKNSSGTWTDLHSADGEGLTGKPGDRAFDNSASTGMGSSGTGGRGDAYDGDVAAIDSLMSFTLSGWYKTTGGVALGSSARLIENWYSNNGFQLFGYQSQLGLQVDNLSALSGSTSDYPDIGTWTFFAVTYDGSSTSGNVKFYKGGVSTPVSLVSTQTINAGQVNEDLATLAIGNVRYATTAYARPFDGLMDNIRIEGSSSDASGALSLSNIEAIRVTDYPPSGTVIVIK